MVVEDDDDDDDEDGDAGEYSNNSDYDIMVL